jgi:hypothetical protein
MKCDVLCVLLFNSSVLNLVPVCIRVSANGL